ncbi:MgtC/SapB family protein [Tardiphaga sp. vice352]|uniref:MgtC/SapB family protein n=1 Tax=unclassified Tardiphaga TaxID=2631404 RepID=UPI0011625536|nr:MULTISPECIES: DUF4010 domain-containing protein [unclassified Tardiphaga]QDM16678.1 MgtC/SapB family protein [Tardiphaga sp. vice278]QDM21701.1 MgtC/SapB family protein [Tardiphaga sp. vice154]QDM26884.1 MgtC/SapB family protein [Tardiphaga sp. vice304]QDM31953.1 MgtC/SapB family protein [Tardiphaga sp. vice352]
MAIDPLVLKLGAALGIGLLIGVERERRKGSGASRSPAGIRTFAVGSLAGAVSVVVGGVMMLAVTTAGVLALVAIAYWRGNTKDPGLTTELALAVTVMLGGLSIQNPVLAGGVAVALAILLAIKSHLHRFVSRVLTEAEMRDALILAAATLIVLPLVPNRPMGPYGALNPHAIWLIVILIMAIGAAGYVAVRVLGSRFGLPAAGLASGFISSAATIGAMGTRAAKAENIVAAAVAGAVLSTVATVVQMALVLASTSMATLAALSVPLGCAGVAAGVYGAIFTVLALRGNTEADPQTGRAFSLRTALIFAITLSVILLASAALQDRFGENGIIFAAAMAGFADTHSAAISVAALVASGKLAASDALLPILAAFSTNTITKVVLAATSGTLAFAVRVIPGLFLVALAAWAGAFGGFFAG